MPREDDGMSHDERPQRDESMFDLDKMSPEEKRWFLDASKGLVVHQWQYYGWGQPQWAQSQSGSIVCAFLNTYGHAFCSPMVVCVIQGKLTPVISA